MDKTFKNRLARLEAARRAPGALWSIPIEIVEMDMETGAIGRVVGRIPSRLIEPGEPFDYRRGIDELAAAMGYADETHL